MILRFRVCRFLLLMFVVTSVTSTAKQQKGRQESEDERTTRQNMEEKVVLLSPHSEGGPPGSAPPAATITPPTPPAKESPVDDADSDEYLDQILNIDELTKLANELLQHVDAQGKINGKTLHDNLMEKAEAMDKEITIEDWSTLTNLLNARQSVATDESELGDAADGGVSPSEPDDDADDESVASPPLSPEEQHALDLFKQAREIIEKAQQAGQKSLLTQAYRMLDESMSMGNTDAKAFIAYAYLFGDYLPWNPEVAQKMFEELALTGNPSAQMGLAFLHATGIAVQAGSSQARALVYLTFAALGDDPLAQMALGYRHMNGINVKADCEAALTWYKKVADRVAAEVRNGTSLSILRQRLPDELEQVTPQTPASAQMMDESLLQYYRFLADKGDLQAQIGLGQLYLTGGRGVEQDFDQAYHYFREAAEQGSANAFAYLGKMYLDGHSTATPQDNNTAFQYFKRATEKANPVGQAGLGVMYLYGKGVEQDYAKAFRYFTQASEQGWVDGQLNLGHMYFNGLGIKRDYKMAIKYFQLASQSGHVLAYYNLAQIHAVGTGTIRNCATAVELYKNVAERGRWSMRLMEAYNLYRAGAVDQAAFKYLFLAELGFEIAQTNFAYLLDKGIVQMFNKSEISQRALLYWTRSANQGYGLSRVKLGDYHYYGWGTPVDYESAAYHYKTASEQQQNAQAMFNLGFMHEQGLGIKQDIYLAKRFYDMAAETSTDAEVPVNLALAKLAVVFAWHNIRDLPVIEAMRLQAFTYMGNDWDMYLIGAISGLLIILIFAKLRQR